MDTLFGWLFAVLALLILAVGLGALVLAVTEAPLASLPFADALKRRQRRAPTTPAAPPAIAAASAGVSAEAIPVDAPPADLEPVEAAAPSPSAEIDDQVVSEATEGDEIAEALPPEDDETAATAVLAGELPTEPDHDVAMTTPIDTDEASNAETIDAATSELVDAADEEIATTNAPATEEPTTEQRPAPDRALPE
jgi:hypothetical protein